VCHFHFIQNAPAAPAKLITVTRNITIVHQSVLRVLGSMKKSSIGPPCGQEIAEKVAASMAADRPVFRKPDVSGFLLRAGSRRVKPSLNHSRRIIPDEAE
jgi:hypothetical protein